MEIYEEENENIEEEQPNSGLLKDISRRRFMQFGSAVIVEAAFYMASPALAWASDIGETPDPTFPVEDENELSDVQTYIDKLNYGCELLGVRLEPGFIPGEPCEDVQQIVNALEPLGGIINTTVIQKGRGVGMDIPALVDVMSQLRLPITKIYGPHLSDPFLSYSYNGVQYMFDKSESGQGYHAMAQRLGSDTQDFQPTFGKIYENSYAALDVCIPIDDPYESFLSKALNKHARYDATKVQVATCEGFYDGLFDTKVMDSISRNYESAYGIPKTPFFRHTLYSNSFLAKTFRGTKYEGLQFTGDTLDDEMVIRYQNIENGEIFTPLVLSDPNSIVIQGKAERFAEIYNSMDPDKMKVLHLISTPNRSEKVDIFVELPKQLIVCSTVSTDSEGYYLPDRRSYIEGYPNHFFLFPDVCTVLDVELAVEVDTNTNVKAVREFYATPMGGASLSTTRATAFFSSVLTEWLSRGNIYSHDEFMTLIYELCPLTNIRSEAFGIIQGRVPDIEKIDEWFSQTVVRLPQIHNSLNQSDLTE